MLQSYVLTVVRALMCGQSVDLAENLQGSTYPPSEVKALHISRDEVPNSRAYRHTGAVQTMSRKILP